jgi:hypothetical protein
MKDMARSTPRKNSGWTKSLVSKHIARASAMVLKSFWFVIPGPHDRSVSLRENRTHLCLVHFQEPAKRFSNRSEQ